MSLLCLLVSLVTAQYQYYDDDEQVEREDRERRRLLTPSVSPYYFLHHQNFIPMEITGNQNFIVSLSLRDLTSLVGIHRNAKELIETFGQILLPSLLYIIEERTNYILLSKEVSADEEDAILDVSNI